MVSLAAISIAVTVLFDAPHVAPQRVSANPVMPTGFTIARAVAETLRPGVGRTAAYLLAARDAFKRAAPVGPPSFRTPAGKG